MTNAARRKPFALRAQTIMQRLTLALVSAIVWVVASTVPSMAARVRAPGTAISMDLPPGFTPAARFSGFMHEALNASFLIVEMPAAAFNKMKAESGPDVLAARGFLDVKPGQLSLPNEHIYITAEQIHAQTGLRFAKFILVLRGADKTYMVSGNLPKQSVPKLSLAVMQTAMESLRIETDEAPQKDLFTLKLSGDFKLAGSALGQTRMYVRDGAPMGTAEIRKHPMFVVAPSIDQQDVGDLDAAARALLTSTASVKSIEVTTTEPITIDGLKGLVMLARGLDKTDGSEIKLYQVLLPLKGGGFFRLLGLTPAEPADSNIAAFRSMAASFKRTR
jgi:hypothetical protein